MIKNLFKIILIFSLLAINTAPSFAKASAAYNIIQDPKGIYVVEINSKYAKNKLIPYVSETLETNTDVYKKLNPKFVVNTGFFDANNSKTVSYIIKDGTIISNPKENENLMQNPALKPFMNKILNRSEFRILEDTEGNILYDIARHNDKVQNGYKIKHSIQAGPMLLPELNLEDEFFILKNNGKIISESAASLHKFARTAIGIKNNNVYIFLITNEMPMNLKELADLTRKWGMEKSMGFDGGGSTSFDSRELHLFSEKGDLPRKLKSFLVLY